MAFSQALMKKALHALRGQISPQLRLENVQGNFHAGGAAVTAPLTDLAAGLLRHRAAVLAIAVAPKNNDQPVVHDSRDHHIRRADHVQIKIRHLHADIRTFHVPQETDAASAEMCHGMKRVVEIFQIAARRLIEFDPADQPQVGVPGMIGVGANVFGNRFAVEIIRVRLMP